MNKKIIILIATIFLSILFVNVQNNSLVTTKFKVISHKIPGQFNGFTIVHLSDLHGKQFGNNQNKLISRIKAIKPDLIVFTGDLVDSRRYKEEPGLLLLEELVQIADVYYVSGNHEKRSNYEQLKLKLKDKGVSIMDYESNVITREDEQLVLIGIEDLGANHNQVVIGEQLSVLDDGSNGKYSILLSHRPDYFKQYKEHGINLVFAGHAHGGQFRLPFIGGFVAPGQGLNPEYDAGSYTDGDTTMIVNRGLGNSIIPVRLFNRPEIVVVTLYSD